MEVSVSDMSKIIFAIIHGKMTPLSPSFITFYTYTKETVYQVLIR